MNDMIALDFSNTGYIYMALIWSIAGFLGAYFAFKKGRSPFFWGILCLIVPMALFAIGGMRAPGEPVPAMFRKENQENEPSDK